MSNVEQVTARLENWSLSHGRVIGDIYDDIRNRWPDGTYVITSPVVEITESKLTTKNSVYELGKNINDTD